MSTEVAEKQEAAPVVANDAATIMAVISKAASNPEIDVERMERLLSMYERQQANQAEIAFNEALAHVQNEIPVIPTDGEIKVNGEVRSRFAKWPTINKIIKPILAKHGMSLTFPPASNGDGLIKIVGELRHEQGHSIRTEPFILPADNSGSKNMVQSMGSSSSYGKRYVAKGLLNITEDGEDEDDDGQSATKARAEEKIPPVRLRKIVEGILEATEKEDGPGLLEIVDELTTGEQLFVWSQFRSWERTAIKKILNPARAAANNKTDPNYIDPLDAD